MSPLKSFVFLVCLILLFNNKGYSADSGYLRNYAFGVAFSHGSRAIDPESSFSQTTPELLGYRFLPFLANVKLRSGFRISYAWMRPESDIPKSFEIRETDLKTGAEIGILWTRFFMIPSFTIGSGMIHRQTKLMTAPPIIPSLKEDITGSSLLPFITLQIGALFPVKSALFEISPFARYTHIFSDSRYSWSLGAEASVGWL